MPFSITRAPRFITKPPRRTRGRWPSGSSKKIFEQYLNGSRIIELKISGRFRMRRFFWAQIAVLIFVSVCFMQEQTDESILSVLDSKWERVRVAGQKIDNNAVAPVRGLAPSDKYYQRASRANQPKGVPDPSEDSTDGRA